MDERGTKRRLDRHSTSTAPPPPSPPREDERHPWPRDNRTPIQTLETFSDPKEAVNNKRCTHCPLTNECDDYCLFYNAWLNVSIYPTRYIDWFLVRQPGLQHDLHEMITELGLGTKATGTHNLYPALVRKFMATVQVFYANERVRRVGEGTLSFFDRGIRHKISITDLCTIYMFENPDAEPCEVSAFAGQSRFWSILGTGHFDAGSNTHTDIRHPTLRYFMRVLDNTMLYKMEPNKVRIHETRCYTLG